MSKFNCFSALVGRKKKEKGDKSTSNTDDYQKEVKSLEVRLEGSEKSSENDKMKSKSVSFGIAGSSRGKAKVMSHESPINVEDAEVAYEGEDEHEENLSMKRENSDFDLQAQVGDLHEEIDRSTNKKKMEFFYDRIEKNAEKDVEEGVDLIQTGHASDPGIGKVEFWALPKLKRSCSNLETRDLLKNVASDRLSPSNPQSLKVLKRLSERFGDQVFDEIPQSSGSVMTHCSADKVMLKKHSSSQVLPSRSRSLWWKSFLWSHRNPRSGYCSDTLETNRGFELGKMESPGSFTGGEEPVNRETNNGSHHLWGGFGGGVSGFLPQNQWVAFSTKSPLRRVDEWVKDLATQPPLPVSDDHNSDGIIVFPPSPDTGKSPANVTKRPSLNVSEEILYANSVIQSLNSSSVVAHITGIGLKVMPTLFGFSSLRSVNLSGNSIVHLTPGSLPKGLHTLNLSRNKISTIDGFRELTRLRILDLSYNRITRIGRGLSNCTQIKELYLAGNKISVVEGLHRLLKLTVLDLSFNKIITTKTLGQIVANYHSLLALNLLGNPIQSNISDDQLRKAVCSLFPKLAYLNKQPISQQKAREVPTESIAKAAVGSSRSKAVKRVMSQGGQQRSRHVTKSRTYHNHPMKMKASELPSSSH